MSEATAERDPVKHLARLRNSEDRQMKGDDGTRSTREVAEACGITIGTARRRLWKAADAGLIEAFDGGASGTRGNEIFWRALL